MVLLSILIYLHWIVLIYSTFFLNKGEKVGLKFHDVKIKFVIIHFLLMWQNQHNSF